MRTLIRTLANPGTGPDGRPLFPKLRKLLDFGPLELVRIDDADLVRSEWRDVYPCPGPDGPHAPAVSYGRWAAADPVGLVRADDAGTPYEWARLAFEAPGHLSYSDHSGSAAERSNCRVLEDRFPAGWTMRTPGGLGTDGVLIPAAVWFRIRCGACDGGPRPLEWYSAAARAARAAEAADEIPEPPRARMDGYGPRTADRPAESPCDGCLQAAELRDKIQGLERYPVLNDDDVSELESEAETGAWNDYGRDDFERALRARFPGPRGADGPEFDVPDSFPWFDVFRAACDSANCYPEHETGGGVYFDVGGAAGAVEWPDLAEHGAAFPRPRAWNRAAVRRARGRAKRADRKMRAFQRRAAGAIRAGLRAGLSQNAAVSAAAKRRTGDGRDFWAEELRLGAAWSRARRELSALEDSAQVTFWYTPAPRGAAGRGTPRPRLCGAAD